jgi:GTP-binding protein
MLRVAIIGRPNVGKSTLFNRLTGKQLAIVDDTPGVTRDWRESDGRLLDQKLRVIDTAGLEEKFDDSMEARMRRQTEQALGISDVIIFVVDGRAGLTPIDHHFAQWLRKQKKPIVLLVNKCEQDSIADSACGEAYALGLGEPIPFSSAHGIGLDALYTAMMPYFPKEAEEPNHNDDSHKFWSEEELDRLEGDESFEFLDLPDPALLDDTDSENRPPIRIAIVGRPNAGKSTLMNALLEEDRVITGPEAGLTRDSIAVDWQWGGKKFRLVDTAGLRKKARIAHRLEQMAVDDTLRAIRLSQIVFLLVDAVAPLERQDLQIADLVIREGRVLIIGINKWDAVEDKNKKLEEIKNILFSSLAQIPDIPLVTLSALREQNLDKLMDTAVKSYTVWNKRVSTGRLNRWLAARVSQIPPPLVNNRPNKLRFMSQINVRPPTFALWVSKPDNLPDTYKRYLINNLRKDYDLPGIPIRLLLRKSKNPFSD